MSHVPIDACTADCRQFLGYDSDSILVHLVLHGVRYSFCCPIDNQMKMVLYLFFVAGYNNDGDIQRKGFVVVIWFDPNTELDEPSRIKSNIDSMADLFPVISTRIAAIHLCTPDTPIHRIGRSILAMALSFYERTRLKFHTGGLPIAASSFAENI